MLFMAAFLAPALALAPPAPVVDSGSAGQLPLVLHSSTAPSEPPVETRAPERPAWLVADSWRRSMKAHQVRIRQEIMIRVSPRRPNSREMVADWQRVLPRQFEQKKIGKCLPARQIVAVQTMSPRDLVLYLSDRRMVRAQLQKSCNARDFYLGFYIEENGNGELCVGRDTLRSRNGATCKIGAIRELVPSE